MGKARFFCKNLFFFFRKKMAQIFQSFFMKKEFEDLYRVLIPNLNKCGNCGSTKCFQCKVFNYPCVECQHFRCKNCIKFIHSVKSFYENAKDEEWDYIFNFLHDIFRVSDITSTNFTGIWESIQFPTIRTDFIVSRYAGCSFFKFI